MSERTQRPHCQELWPLHGQPGRVYLACYHSSHLPCILLKILKHYYTLFKNTYKYSLHLVQCYKMETTRNTWMRRTWVLDRRTCLHLSFALRPARHPSTGSAGDPHRSFVCTTAGSHVPPVFRRCLMLDLKVTCVWHGPCAPSKCTRALFYNTT